MSLASQIHVLGDRGQGSSSECFDLPVGQGYMAIPPSAFLTSSTAVSGGAADESNFDLSGVNGCNVVASVV